MLFTQREELRRENELLGHAIADILIAPLSTLQFYSTVNYYGIRIWMLMGMEWLNTLKRAGLVKP